MVGGIARSPRGRAAAILIVGCLLAQLAMLVGAAPARAVTCPVKVSEGAVQDRQVSPTVRAGYSFAPQCSDGNARVWGWVTDPLCDSREAVLDYWIYDRRSDGSYAQIASGTARADNGCGNTSNFNHTRNSPGSLGWRFKIRIRACSSAIINPCSDGGSLTYNG